MKNEAYNIAVTTLALGASFFYYHGTTYALPTDSQVATSSSPFHDCLDTGKSWGDCSLAASPFARDLKRDIATSGSPFHDCLDTGKSFGECTLAVQSYSTRDITVVERGLPFQFDGVINDLGVNNIGGTSQCYSVNKLGGTGWLDNTAVKNLKTSACSFAINQALTSTGIGKFTKTGLSGFYQGNGGPIVDGGVKFFLSTLFQGDYSNLPVGPGGLQQFGEDLCSQGIDHLLGDPHCTSARKSGGNTEHTSVNGGAFNWALNGAQAVIDQTGICTNCILTMVMEAANKVDKDGTTSVPIDS